MKYLPWVILALVILALAWFFRRAAKLPSRAPDLSPHTVGGASGGNIFDRLAHASAGGCAGVATSQIKGLPTGIAVAGCSTYTKYLTPLGVAGIGYKAVTSPVSTAKSIGGAVKSGVSKIASIF